MQQQGVVRDCVLGASGQLVATAVGGPNLKAVRIQRKDNARQTLAMYTGAGMPLDVIWTPKPNKVYVSCSDNTVKVFDGARARLLRTLTGHNNWVYAIALSADGSKLASGSADGTVKLWSGGDGRLLATLVQLSPNTDDWLIIAAEGHLATSSASALTWKGTNLSAPSDQLTREYDNAELVQQVLAGKKVERPAAEKKTQKPPQRKPRPQQKKQSPQPKRPSKE
jgi:WD40 repeat protein